MPCDLNNSATISSRVRQWTEFIDSIFLWISSIICLVDSTSSIFVKACFFGVHRLGSIKDEVSFFGSFDIFCSLESRSEVEKSFSSDEPTKFSKKFGGSSLFQVGNGMNRVQSHPGGFT
jgi:hypothetical protein